MPISDNQINDDAASLRDGLDGITAMSGEMPLTSAESASNASSFINKQMLGQVQNRDYVIVHGRPYTLDGLRGHFEQIRREAFDLEIIQTPLMHESEAALTPLDANQKYLYDTTPYDLADPLADRRIKSRFEFLGNFLMGIGHVIDVVMTKKRQVTSEYADLNVEWQLLYAQASTEYKAEMGKSEQQRRAWMTRKYNALSVGYSMYGDFLKEIQDELDRLEYRQQTTSRALSAFEADAKQRNLFNDYKDSGSIK